MAREILGEFGNDAPDEEAPRATSGGVKTAKKLAYSEPKGPTTFSHEGPGLANHTNYGCCGTQGKR